MQFGVETKTRLRAANGSNKRPTATNDSMYYIDILLIGSSQCGYTFDAIIITYKLIRCINFH